MRPFSPIERNILALGKSNRCGGISSSQIRMKPMILFLFAISILFARGAAASNGAIPMGEPVLEPPTLRSLGVYWIVRGDENRNARVEVAYRAAGRGRWRQGPPLFRVERGAHQP